MRFRKQLLPHERPPFSVVGPKVLAYIQQHTGPTSLTLIAEAIGESEMSVFFAINRLKLEGRISVDRYPKKSGYRRITVIET